MNKKNKKFQYGIVFEAGHLLVIEEGANDGCSMNFEGVEVASPSVTEAAETPDGNE